MSCKCIEEVRAAVKSENATAALKEIEDLFATLAAAGFSECVNLDLSIVRGLAYYTGIVFEVFDKGKSMRAIAGGGRYDSLTEKLGGDRIPSVATASRVSALAWATSCSPTSSANVDFCRARSSMWISTSQASRTT